MSAALVLAVASDCRLVLRAGRVRRHRHSHTASSSSSSGPRSSVLRGRASCVPLRTWHTSGCLLVGGPIERARELRREEVRVRGIVRVLPMLDARLAAADILGPAIGCVPRRRVVDSPVGRVRRRRLDRAGHGESAQERCAASGASATAIDVPQGQVTFTNLRRICVRHTFTILRQTSVTFTEPPHPMPSAVPRLAGSYRLLKGFTT